MRILPLSVAAVGTCLAVSMVMTGTSGAASGTGVYAGWSVSGSSASASLAGTVFPAITGVRTGGSWQAASGGSTWLSASTPFGREYGSSQGKDYLYTSLPLNGTSAGVSVTFATAPAAGTWGFTLGDVDAEDITITASDASGAALDVSDWYQSSFNYCAVSPKPSACPAGTHTDQPTWASPILRGSANDTHGAAAWFQPTGAVKTLTFTQARNVPGAPIYQLWIAADVLASPSPSPSSSASQSDSASPSPSAAASDSADASPEATASPTPSAPATDETGASEATTEGTATSDEPSGAETDTGSEPTVSPETNDAAPPDTPQVVDMIEQAGAPEGSTISDVEKPRHGTAEVVDNVVVYTPDPGYIGTDRIVATITTPDGTDIRVRSVVRTGLEQRPTRRLGLPSSVSNGRTTVLIDHAVRTNADQYARVSGTCTAVTRMRPEGGFSGCIVTRDGSKLMVTVAGGGTYRVTVTITAPSKGDYLPYRLVKAYTVRS